VSATASKSLPSLRPLVEFQGSKNVILSAVKRAEDDADVSRGILPTKNQGKSIVVRLYDSLGGKSIGSIVSNLRQSRKRSRQTCWKRTKQKSQLLMNMERLLCQSHYEHLKLLHID